jgi:hypothetical protein
MFFELADEMTVGEIVFGDSKYTAGIFVQPVDDTGSEWSPYISQLIAMVEETVYQGRLPVASSRVNHQAWGFVDCDQIIIFKNNVQRKRFRHQFRRRNRWQEYGDFFSGPQPVARLLLLVVDPDVILLNEALNLIARQL